jgi:uncharacterized protein YcbX
MSNLKLQDIYIYPIKSCAGIRVSEWQVLEKGLQYDRQWMLVDQNQQFLSQRKLPKMALLKTRLTDHHIILSAPGFEDISFNLHQADGKTLTVSIWKDQCQANLVSAEADEWLSDFLKMDCNLVYQPKQSIRQVDQKYAMANDNVYFSDGFPFLIISENSLVDLNSHMPYEISMTRFRPNLVISGSASYAEDFWREISIGEINFRLPKPCSRCPVPNIDPETGISSKETIKTLSKIRKRENKVYFGQNALHNNTGQLFVGDLVTVNTTGPAQPL